MTSFPFKGFDGMEFSLSLHHRRSCFPCWILYWNGIVITVEEDQAILYTVCVCGCVRACVCVAPKLAPVLTDPVLTDFFEILGRDFERIRNGVAS